MKLSIPREELTEFSHRTIRKLTGEDGLADFFKGMYGDRSVDFTRSRRDVEIWSRRCSQRWIIELFLSFVDLDSRARLFMTLVSENLALIERDSDKLKVVDLTNKFYVRHLKRGSKESEEEFARLYNDILSTHLDLGQNIHHNSSATFNFLKAVLSTCDAPVGDDLKKRLSKFACDLALAQFWHSTPQVDFHEPMRDIVLRVMDESRVFVVTET